MTAASLEGPVNYFGEELLLLFLSLFDTLLMFRILKLNEVTMSVHVSQDLTFLYLVGPPYQSSRPMQ